MKLLYCPDCKAIFTLSFENKSCDCGLVEGKYLNRIDAETNGKGISLAIGNGSFERAFARMLYPQIDHFSDDSSLDRNFYKNECSFLAWVRPNDGAGNPHTKISTEQ